MNSISKSKGVMMTGVYRSGTEFALQLLQGHKEINCSMYYINVFRYIEDIEYNSGNILEAINKINKYTSLRYNIKFFFPINIISISYPIGQSNTT